MFQFFSRRDPIHVRHFDVHDDQVVRFVIGGGTFVLEKGFFRRHGFQPIDGQAVPPEVFAELLRSYDEGVAEFLDLERVKPNTLGNTRMLLTL